MDSLLNFSINLLFFSLAWLFGIWIESFAYWYTPDAVFILVIWLLFVQQRLNYLVFMLFTLLADVYLENQFGSSLLILLLLLYLLGALGFGNYAPTLLIGTLGVSATYLLYEQLVLFINLGVHGLLQQQLLFPCTKALVTGLAWLLMVVLIRLRHKNHEPFF